MKEMKMENVNYIKTRVDDISELSFSLIEKSNNKDKHIDIYSDAYKINQKAHELKHMLKNCSVS